MNTLYTIINYKLPSTIKSFSGAKLVSLPIERRKIRDFFHLTMFLLPVKSKQLEKLSVFNKETLQMVIVMYESFF